jgi:hypothetical protein
MKTLPSKTNIWYNCDNKNPVWIGGKEEYGKKNNPIKPYHRLPSTYLDILKDVRLGIEKDRFETERFAIITGHIENYKEGYETRMRLKTLGQLNNKMQLEGKLESVFYSTVVVEGGENKYLLETQNNGYNTARSPEGLFDSLIPNDYNLIISELLKY